MSLIAHYLHKWKFRFSVLLGLLMLWPLQSIILSSLQQQALTAHTFELPNPLPDTLIKKWDLPSDKAVSKVYLTGGFADWHSDAPFYAFRLKPSTQNPKKTSWQYSLPLYPGDIEYKFVLYFENSLEGYWITDPFNDNISVNPFGGENSLLAVADWPKISLITQILCAAIAGTFLLYCLLEPLLYWLLHQKMPIYRKLVLSNIVVLLCAQLIFIAYQLHTHRQLVKQGVIDSIHGMHLLITGSGVDVTALPEQKTLINNTLTQYFLPATTRVDKNQSSLMQITLSDFAVLDTKGKLITLRHRAQNVQIQQQRAQQLGFENTEDYFMQGMWQQLLPLAKENAALGQLLTAKRPSSVTSVETSKTLTAEAVLGFSQFIQPIKHQGRLMGYYAGSIQVKLYGSELMKMALFQLLLLMGVVILTAWLLAKVGRIITEDILTLNAWTQDIVAGNLSQEVKFNSQDEIQELSENFNHMRLSLKQSFEKIEEQNQNLFQAAYFNTLTKLPNRNKLYLDLTEQNIEALLMININGFGELNDFYGVKAGDSLLCEMAERLLTQEWSKLVYKTGPDEFVVTFESLISPLEDYSNKISNLLCSQPYQINDNQYFLTVSMGGAIKDATKLTPRERVRLHRHADLARRIAKEQKMPFCLFQQQMADPQAFEDNLHLSQLLTNAVTHQWVTPFVQLIQPLGQHSPKFECLMRIVLPSGDVLAPGQFMKVARQSGIYPQLMRVMLKQCLSAFSNVNYEFSVNITLDDIGKEQNLSLILDILKTQPDVCQRLTFEILESEEINHYDTLAQFIQLVKPLGCKIAVDDFGAGYSNFAHILSLDIDMVKIDGSLIINLVSDPKAQILVETIANFAKKMKILTAAEFVETPEILALLNQYQIDYAQGYLFGRPERTITQALALAQHQ